MTKKIEEEKRVRKEYAPAGQRSQKRFGFLVDLDNWERLQKEPNKGRFINNAIRAYK